MGGQLAAQPVRLPPGGTVRPDPDRRVEPAPELNAPGTALVTGGSRGIGAATVRALAADGWDVALTYRERSAEAAEVAASCRALGRRVLVVQADLVDPTAVADVFAAMDRDLGRLGLLVNNAGITPAPGRVESFDLERLQRVLAINVASAVLAAGQAVRRMSTSHGGDGGVVVNVSSRAAVLGAAGEYVDYAASKAALDALTVGLAREVGGEGIRVVGVRPGLIDTEIHAPGRLEQLGSSPPLRRPGRSEEVAAAIAWLASPQASYVTGTILDVSGGR